MKFGEEEDTIFLSIPAKNQAKIPSIGSKSGLMSPRKKGIHL